ncbi:MAG: S16 family serine protease [Verrucomicrobium sp.]
MKEGEFARWLVGTEWTVELEGKKLRYWFATSTLAILTNSSEPDSQRALGYKTEGQAGVNWYLDPGNLDGPHQMTIADDLKNGLLESAKGQAQASYAGRRPLQPTNRLFSASQFAEWLTTRTLKGTSVIQFTPDGRLWMNAPDNQAKFSIPCGGMVECEWKNSWHRSLIAFSPDLGTYRHMSPLGGDAGRVLPSAEAPSAPLASASPSMPAPTPASGTATIKNRSASVGGLLVVPLGGSRYAGKTSRLSITALRSDDDGPSILTFNQEVGESMGTALKEVSKYHTLRHDGWPAGHKMEISFEDKYSPKDGPSAAVACALLVESVLTGVELDPAFSVTGDMNADGSVQPIGGVIAKLRGATRSGQTLAGIPLKNRTSALDLAVGEGAAPFIGLQLFSVETFDEALALARKDRSAALTQALNTFATVSNTLRSTPSALSSPAIHSALEGIVAAAPNHISARILLAVTDGRLPKQLSAPGSLEAVDQALAAVAEATGSDLTATSSLDSGKLGVARNKLQRLRVMIDTRVHPYVDAWVNWATLADQIITRRAMNAQLLQQFRAAGARINAEGKKLEGNSGFMEEVLR